MKQRHQQLHPPPSTHNLKCINTCHQKVTEPLGMRRNQQEFRNSQVRKSRCSYNQAFKFSTLTITQHCDDNRHSKQKQEKSNTECERIIEPKKENIKMQLGKGTPTNPNAKTRCEPITKTSELATEVRTHRSSMKKKLANDTNTLASKSNHCPWDTSIKDYLE